jgi:hypothetical protein
MNTVSTALALPTSSSHLRVPSVEMLSRTGTGGVMQAVPASLARSDLATSVIWSKSVAPKRCTQRSTCLAEWFLTLLDEPVGERCGIEIEKIDHV